MFASVPRRVGLPPLWFSRSLFLGVAHRTPELVTKRPQNHSEQEKEKLGWRSQGPSEASTNVMPTPNHPSPCRALTLEQQHPPPNAAPSEGAANSQCQTSKLTTTFGGRGPCLVPFSPCADSQARTYELLLFHGEQREGRGLCGRWRLELSFAGE